MSSLAATLRRALWAACACVLLLTPRASAAESFLTADFDGDGVRDHVTLNRDEPSILHVWLSTTGTTTTIRTKAPVIRIVASDLDGDRRAELIASGASSSLQVWTKKHNRFHSYHPRRTHSGAFDRPNHRKFDDGGTDSPSAVPSPGPPVLAIALSGQPRAPALVGLRSTSPASGGRPSALPLEPFAPRPPPSAL
jgi:hypothetical protein